MEGLVLFLYLAVTEIGIQQGLLTVLYFCILKYVYAICNVIWSHMASDDKSRISLNSATAKIRKYQNEMTLILYCHIDVSALVTLGY